MVLVKYIENPSKVSKSTVESGNLFEQEYSKKIHKQNIAILISDRLLRDKNCGQIDLASFNGKIITLYEIKRFGVLSHRQSKRIFKSARMLSEYFTCAVGIEYIFAKK